MRMSRPKETLAQSPGQLSRVSFRGLYCIKPGMRSVFVRSLRRLCENARLSNRTAPHRPAHPRRRNRAAASASVVMRPHSPSATAFRGATHEPPTATTFGSAR